MAKNSNSENKKPAEKIQPISLAKNPYFRPLGKVGTSHYFYCVRSKDIIKATTFTVPQLLNIAPRSYWVENYPGDKGTINQLDAADFLITNSINTGPFDTSRIRGTGVWLDAHRTVINTGNELIVSGNPTDFENVASQFYYVKTAKTLPPLHGSPLLAYEGAVLMDICKSFKWKESKSAKLLAGWVTLARIAGALPIRPHIWVTGGKGSGKSTVLEMFVNPCLGPEGKLVAQGATTEAGIRQTIGLSSIPVIFDEIESNDEKVSTRRVAGVIELLRSTWSQTSGRIMKGTPGGTAVEFTLNFAACLAAIRVKLDNDADVSRVSQLELAHHGGDPAARKELMGKLQIVTPELGARLFARACGLVPEVIASFEVLSQIIAKESTQRRGQQIGMLLAAAWMLEHDEVITESQAIEYSAEYLGENLEDEGLSDEEECLAKLLTWKVELGTTAGAPMLIAEALCGSDYVKGRLKLYGVKVDGDRFTVANHHSELEKHFASSRWGKHWNLALRRLEGAQCAAKTSFGGRKSQSRGVSLPIALAADY